MRRALLASTLVLLHGCDDYETARSLLTDPNFNSWCGDSLCDWETDAGKIRRAATWDSADYGVELASSPSVVSQEADVDMLWPPLTIWRWLSDRKPCLKLSLLGDVATEAEVSLELDFFSDGAPEYAVPIPGTSWRRVEVLVRLPEGDFSSMKVSLLKRGTGKATFANLSVVGVDECKGDPIEIAPRLPGAPCNENTDCQSGLCSFAASGNADQQCEAAPCADGSCGDCAADDDCE